MIYLCLLSQGSEGEIFGGFSVTNSPLQHTCYRFITTVLRQLVTILSSFTEGNYLDNNNFFQFPMTYNMGQTKASQWETQ